MIECTAAPNQTPSPNVRHLSIILDSVTQQDTPTTQAAYIIKNSALIAAMANAMERICDDEIGQLVDLRKRAIRMRRRAERALVGRIAVDSIVDEYNDLLGWCGYHFRAVDAVASRCFELMMLVRPTLVS